MNLSLEIYSVCVTIGLLACSLKLLAPKAPPEEELLDRLLPLLVQYPTLRQGIRANPSLTADQLLPLLGILDSVARYYQLEPIGTVWQQVEFNPQLHQPDSPGIGKGEMVYIRFIGYRSGNKIYAPAKVSRQLPPNALRSRQPD